ncbi:MAG: amidohydrolase [Bacteroidota bacterium]
MKGSQQSLVALLKSLLFGWAVMILVGACQSVKEVPTVSNVATMVLKNGVIYPMETTRQRVTTIAIRENKIVYIGYEAGAQKWIGSETKVVDLGGKMVLPSFTDGHIHPISGGSRLLNCDLTDLRTDAEVIAKIKAYAAANPDKKWIQGGGLWLPSIGGGNPNKSVLDAIDSERPIFITSTDGHNAWVNSKALKIAKVTKDTKNPVGGVIERAADGSPSGTLREYAMGLVRKFIPPMTLEEKAEAIGLAIDIAHQNGITAWVDAAVDEETIQAYLQLEKAGKLDLDVTLALITEIIKEMDAVEEVIALQKKYENESKHINLKSTKILIDGVVEGKTAALFENYVGEDFKGEPYISAEAYNDMVAAYDKAGFQVHVHACGDRGVSMTLDAFEHAQKVNQTEDARHHIVHLQLINEKDIPRFRELDVIANLQTLWATPEDTYISDLTIPVVGPERSAWIYPFGAIANSGAMLANGSDWPVTSMNPFPAIQVALTRRGPDSEVRDPWMPQHLMNLNDVLLGYTNGGAYLNFAETERGALTVGKSADLIVLNQDLFAVPKTEIHKTKVLMTLYRGKVVHITEEIGS